MLHDPRLPEGSTPSARLGIQPLGQSIRIGRAEHTGLQDARFPHLHTHSSTSYIPGSVPREMGQLALEQVPLGRHEFKPERT